MKSEGLTPSTTAGQTIDWHLGFAAAGVGMIVGLIQYVLGKKYLRAVEATAPLDAGVPATVVAVREPLSREDWARIGAAIILTLFADRATRLSTFGFSFPSSLFQSTRPSSRWVFCCSASHSRSSFRPRGSSSAPASASVPPG